MVSSDSAAWALQAPSRRRTAGSRRGSAGSRSASGAGIRRARSRTGAAPDPVPASRRGQVVGGEVVVSGRGRGEIVDPLRRARAENHRGARLDGHLGLPEPPVRPAQRRPVTAGQEPSAGRADDQRRARTGPGPEQCAGGTVEHRALRGTVRRRTGLLGEALAQRLEGTGRRVLLAEGLGHQAPQLRHRDRRGDRCRRRPARPGRRPAGSPRPRPSATPRPSRADRPRRGRPGRTGAAGRR